VDRDLVEYEWEYCFNGVTNKYKIETDHLVQQNGNIFTVFQRGAAKQDVELLRTAIEKSLIPLPAKKPHRTREDVSDEEKKLIRSEHLNDELPSMWVFDGMLKLITANM
jgi:hypothetical protein